MAHKKPVGWRKEPGRHALAAKGVKTALKPRDITSGPFKRTELKGTILVRHEKGMEFIATPSGTRMPFGMEKATDWERVSKKVVIRDSKGARQLKLGIARFSRVPPEDVSTEEAFTVPIFVRGSVADQLAHALHKYRAKIGANKTTYYEAFNIPSGTYFAYLHPDGSFSIRRQTKAGNPPGRGS